MIKLLRESCTNTTSDYKVHDIESGELYAVVLEASVATDPEVVLERVGSGSGLGTTRVVVRSSEPIASHAKESEIGGNQDKDQDEDQYQDAHRLIASWSASGWTDFDESLNRLIEQVKNKMPDIRINILPSADGMLSDAICTLSWVRRTENLDCGLILDPMGWLVPSMMRDVEDHLGRICDLCIQMCEYPKTVDSVMIRSVKFNGEDGLGHSSLGDGDLDPAMIVRCLEPIIRSAGRVIVVDSSDLSHIAHIE
jgi:hypothetical protein